MARHGRTQQLILTGEAERPPGDVLVERDGGIKRYESVQEGFSQEGDEVAAHGDEEAGEGEHHATGGASRDRHAVASDLPQTRVLALHRVVCKCDVTPTVKGQVQAAVYTCNKAIVREYTSTYRLHKHTESIRKV